ncbi:hypothetical protein GFY24_14390 [Nocardia sp. SYP-A9097]|uniref:hypothetical protein n=1 Tax=Nocardia sp. SYP-A9097 TaxID=2663237 RepID=UPI00129A45B5|nr:hypothetical protein [Nocardia sp. SYP-A9097]MRH88617.1 hypothetical protein [Nocardia sp. SYP-A9097]
MGEIPGARAELDRHGRVLRTQLADLIALLTPDADLTLLFLDEPTVADWHEPLKYRYSTTFRAQRAEDVSAPDTVRRGAAMLANAGWEVSESREVNRTLVTGYSNGNTLEIRVPDQVPTVLFSASTPAMALTTVSEPERPDPIRTAATLSSRHVLCYECDGLGVCPECGGRGWLTDAAAGRVTCPECSGGRMCPICQGAGQLAISRLQPFQRRFYPDLPE